MRAIDFGRCRLSHEGPAPMRACPILPPAMPITSERASASCVSISLTCRSSARPDSVSSMPRPRRLVEPGAELALQAVHALGEPRLGDVHGLRRMAQIEPLGRGEEELELAVVHVYVLSVMVPSTLRQLP